jgi:hypothetical protein
MNSNHEEGEDHYTVEDNLGHNQQEEEYVFVDLLNIIGLIVKSTTYYH